MRAMERGVTVSDDETRDRHTRRPLHPGDSGAAKVRWSLAVVVALIVVFYATGWWLPRRSWLSPEIEIYVLRPLLWIGLATLATTAWFRLPDRPAFRWVLPIAGLLVGMFHASMLIIAGLFSGFGRTSPFLSWIDYPLTAISLGAVLIGTEMTRAYLAVAWNAMSRRVSLLIITVLILITGTPINLFSGLDTIERFFRIGGGRLIPALALSGALTWMAARGGPWPTIAYSGVLTVFWWFFPLLPDLSWTAGLLLGGIIPLVSIRLVSSISGSAMDARTASSSHEHPRDRWLGWAVAAVVGLLAVSLFSGTFGVRPFVVTGISMEPALNAGDLILVWEHAGVADLMVGDIIKVDSRDRSLVHRIISIGADDDGTVLVTRGDNVGAPDPPVRPTAIDGKVVFAVPWIGKPALWIRSP